MKNTPKAVTRVGQDHRLELVTQPSSAISM